MSRLLARVVPSVTAPVLVTLIAAGLLYLLVPGHPDGWLNGVPWHPASLIAALLLGSALFAFWPAQPLRRRRPAWLLAGAMLGLTVAKLGVGVMAPQHGLPAWYWANSRFVGQHEPSTDFRGAPWTRLDAELDFGGDEFPLHFLNDVQRFNFFGPEAERRRSLPFSVRWEGTLYAPEAGRYPIWLTASGPATLAINGRQVAAVDADGRDTTATTVDLRPGANELRVTYARRPPRSGSLKVEWELAGRRRPIGSPYLVAAPVDEAAWRLDRALATAGRALDGLFLAFAVGVVGWLAVARARLVRVTPGRRWSLLERPLLGGWLAAMALFATVPALDRAGKLTLLGGGQDWLTHETFARDILVNGPLMTLGKALGEGRTFYAQPFYPYALAGFHWLTGEDLFGTTALQVFGTGVTGVLLYFLAKRLFGTPTALVAFGLFLGLRAWHLDWVARRLLSESVYVVILPALLLCLVRYIDERRRSDLVLGGLFLGLAIVTRGPTLLYVPPMAFLLWRGLLRGGPASARQATAGLPSAGRASASLTARAAFARVAALGVVAGTIVLLVPIRNYLVAGEPALVASSGGVNLQKLHRPTPQVRLGEAQRRPFAPYIQDAPTRETVEFVLQDPLGYAQTYVPLALYTLGYGAAIDESHIAYWPDLILLNGLYLAAIIWLPAARSLRAGLLHAFVLAHFGTMVVFAPYDYDNRLVLPMYLPIVVFAGAALAGAWSLARGRFPLAHRASSPLAAVTSAPERAP